MLEINNLSAGYGTEPVIRGLSLKIRDCEIYALIGPSGCGKSTFIKTLCGILPPLKGRIEYAGGSKAPSIGYVPQNYGLLEWKTVEKNILLPLRAGPCKKTKRGGARDIISSLGLESLLKRYPRELSGGQKQRAALARAFVANPDLLLMDEPFSALDAFTAASSQELFLKVWRKYRVTTLFITHNAHEAAALATRLLLMDASSGKIGLELANPAFGSSSDSVKAKTALHIKNLLKELADENAGAGA